jgi:hypothetical protein
VLRNLLSRKIRLRAHVHKIDDIAALLRLVDEFKINVTVDHAGDVYRPEIFQELKKRKIPVVWNSNMRTGAMCATWWNPVLNLAS